MNLKTLLRPYFFWAALSPLLAASPLDTIEFGHPASEQAHAFQSTTSEVIKGGLGETARRLLPPAKANWDGGRLSFTLKVDPVRPNYITTRFWGGEANPNRLILFCEGKQIGYRHLGDVDILDFGSDEDAPPYNGRFYYKTDPLPLALTKGKTELHCEIRATGRIWGYGDTFDRYQKPMEGPTRGIYRIYSHLNGCFVPPEEEKQGNPPVDPPIRTAPGAEVLDQLKARVSQDLASLLGSKKPLNQMEIQFLAKAYWVKWSPAYQNPKVIDLVAAGADKLYADFCKDPRLAQLGPGSWNPGWFGYGPLGEAFQLLAPQLQAGLDQKLPDGSTRREGWTKMLAASRDWHQMNRRLYTNQSMITDLYGIYLSNRGVAAIAPGQAKPETQMLDYLYQSVGLKPWLGSDTEHGPAMSAGNDYWQLTDRGLTRELGFVGYYGEVLDWVTSIYNATRPAPDQPGDEKIRAQMEKIAHARAVFRYPMLDPEGNRAMRAETIIGWRDAHYPGEVTYGERVSWDGSALYEAAAALDEKSIGYAQQMFADNQFFRSVEGRMKEKGLRVTVGLLPIPGQYEWLKAQTESTQRLPMTAGQPDFVWTDEQDGVVALKNGPDIFYVSLYWRARNAINFLARIHCITPQFDRIATVREDIEFQPSGLNYTRQDWVDFGFAKGGHKYPADLHSSLAGEILPIAKIPQGVNFKQGDENIFAGKGDFYTLRYGPYLIAMNTTRDKIFPLKIPDGFTPIRELVSGRNMPSLESVSQIGPRSTVVLYAGQWRSL